MASRRRSSDPPPLEIRRFTSEEVTWAVGLLETRISEVEGLDPKTVPYNHERVRATELRIRTTILEIFGERSPEYQHHQVHEISGHLSITVVGWGEDPSYHDAQRQEDFARGLPRTVTMLRSLIDTVKERTISARPVPGNITAATGPLVGSREVFIVHGHADGPREMVARLIAKLGLNPIILHEQVSAGRTIIEKIERHSDVGYAVILLTADDRGGPRDADPASYLPRARQNVVLELGYFSGKLGRRHVCVLYEPGVEIPSDYQGVVYVPLDAGGAWQFILAKEMKAAGFDIDLNLVM